MDVVEFNNNFLNNLLGQVCKEQKFVFLLRDFNINLMNYNYHRPTNKFFDSRGSNSRAVKGSNCSFCE